MLLIRLENPKVVAELLGHSTVVTTLQLYSHASMAMTQQATDRLGTLLDADAISNHDAD